MTRRDDAERSSARRDGNGKHIVDVLIEERAPRLSSSPLWPIVRPPLNALLDYREARAMADALAPLAGADALEHVSALLGLAVTTRGLEHVPAQGRCILVANHPTGVADGIAMYDALKSRRPDVCFFANADALRVCAGFDDVLIPVQWPAAKRTLESSKETLRQTQAALESERLIVIYPAGEIARRADGEVRDPPWEDSAVAIARKHDVPLVPAHASGPAPRLFLLFDRFSEELRDITLFHELLNKKRGAYEITFGPRIDPDALRGEADAITERLKAYVEEELARSPLAAFA